MLKKLLWAVLLAAVAGCQTVQTTQPGAVGIERKQSMMLSSAEVNASAGKAYQQLIAGEDKKGQVNRDSNQVARIRGIANRLIPQTRAFRADAPGWQWQVNVISAKDVNAWCMPGGKIAVYTGLLEKLKPSDDEIAAVMGHEIAHALREHGRERASQAMAQGMAISILGAVAGVSRGGMDLSQLMLDLTLNLPNSRQHETEADRIGVELAARAGYDPRAAITLWEKMGKLNGGKSAEFLSTHPSNTTRIGDLQVYAARVMPLYEQSKPAPR
ncbi:MAG: M48 family metallopeptidase [Betaproteobacteria bacterium]|nr:M48 family metallopeptidase [Betaproteobacteria bacterium]